MERNLDTDSSEQCYADERAVGNLVGTTHGRAGFADRWYGTTRVDLSIQRDLTKFANISIGWRYGISAGERQRGNVLPNSHE